jgi:hypothetical protein
MAKTASGIYASSSFIESPPKKTRQGRGKHTKYTATSRNKPKKMYRGQGR